MKRRNKVKPILVREGEIQYCSAIDPVTSQLPSVFYSTYAHITYRAFQQHPGTFFFLSFFSCRFLHKSYWFVKDQTHRQVQPSPSSSWSNRNRHIHPCQPVSPRSPVQLTPVPRLPLDGFMPPPSLLEISRPSSLPGRARVQMMGSGNEGLRR